MSSSKDRRRELTSTFGSTIPSFVPFRSRVHASIQARRIAEGFIVDEDDDEAEAKRKRKGKKKKRRRGQSNRPCVPPHAASL